MTLKVGIASWAFQSAACISAFLWAAGACEVFVSTSTSGPACYYQLPHAAVLLTFIPACLLLYATHSKLISLMLSVFHGDYLYAVTYDVPFRIVHATAPSHPTGSLLTVGLHGDDGLPEAPPPQLSCEQKCELYHLLRTGRAVWIFLQHTIIATVASGPLFRKLMSVSVEQEWSFHVMGAAKCFTVLAAIAPLALCLRFSYSANFWRRAVAQGALCDILRDMSPLSDLFWYLGMWLCGVASTLHVAPQFWHDGADILQESWIWSFHGIAAFVFAVLFLDFMDRKVRLLGGVYDTTWHISEVAWDMLVNDFPEWQVQKFQRAGYDVLMPEGDTSDEAENASSATRAPAVNLLDCWSA